MSNPVAVKKYDVLFAGHLRTGFTQSMIMENISNSTLLSNGRVEEIDFKKDKAVIYSSPSKGKAMQVCRALSDAGLSCKVRRINLSADKNEHPKEPMAARYIILALLTIIAILILRSILA